VLAAEDASTFGLLPHVPHVTPRAMLRRLTRKDLRAGPPAGLTIQGADPGPPTSGYDANGNRTSLSYPNGTVTGYAYDDLNRLRNLATTVPFVTELGPLAIGQS